MAFLDDDGDTSRSGVTKLRNGMALHVTRAISANSEFTTNFIPGGICLLFNLLESSAERRSSAINLKIRKHFRKAFQRLAQFTWNSCVFAKRNALVCAAQAHTAPRASERVNSLPLINLMRRACVSLPENIYSSQ
jgi:hypothetical protein